MSDLLVPIHSGVTPSLHPDMIAGVAPADDELLQADLKPAVDAFATAYTVLAGIHDARKVVEGDSTLTPDGRILTISDYADKKLPAATRAMDVAMRQVDSTIRQLEGALSAPLKASAERGVVASEVRGHVKSMKPGERMTFVKEAIGRGDAETVGAILGAPMFLSGGTDLEKEHLTRAWNQRAHPEASRRLEVLRKAKDALDSNAAKVLTEFERAIGTKRGLVQKLRERKAQTAAALR